MNEMRGREFSEAVILRRASGTDDAEAIARIVQACYAAWPELFSLKKIREVLGNPRVCGAAEEGN